MAKEVAEKIKIFNKNFAKTTIKFDSKGSIPYEKNNIN